MRGEHSTIWWVVVVALAAGIYVPLALLGLRSSTAQVSVAPVLVLIIVAVDAIHGHVHGKDDPRVPRDSTRVGRALLHVSVAAVLLVAGPLLIEAQVAQ
jgi:hypothetical protein